MKILKILNPGPAFNEPQKPSDEFLPTQEITQSHDQTQQSKFYLLNENFEFFFFLDPEKTNNDLQIEETPQSEEQKKLSNLGLTLNFISQIVAEYWDFKKSLGLGEQDEDQMSIEPEGPPPMLPEEPLPEPEGTPPMIPEIPEEEGSPEPEGPPPMFPDETPEGTPPMLPEGSPGYDDEALGTKFFEMNREEKLRGWKGFFNKK